MWQDGRVADRGKIAAWIETCCSNQYRFGSILSNVQANGHCKVQSSHIWLLRGFAFGPNVSVIWMSDEMAYFYIRRSDICPMMQGLPRDSLTESNTKLFGTLPLRRVCDRRFIGGSFPRI